MCRTDNLSQNGVMLRKLLQFQSHLLCYTMNINMLMAYLLLQVEHLLFIRCFAGTQR
jgi:hypothetical protein